MEIPLKPFKILALAPFSAINEGASGRLSPIAVGRTELNDAMAALAPSLYKSLPEELCTASGIEIAFSELKDFTPGAMVKRVSYLNQLVQAREYAENAEAKGMDSDQMSGDLAMQFPDLPSLEPAKKKQATKPAESSIDNILSMVAVPGDSDDESPASGGGRLSTQIENIIGNTYIRIFSDDQFRQIEATWRGLDLLLRQGGVGSGVSVEIAPISADTLVDTLDNLAAHLVDDLPSLLLFDLPFDNSPRSMAMLGKIAEFAEMLLVPAVTWIEPGFFNVSSWEDIDNLAFLPNLIEETPFAKWRKLKESSPGRWLAATCNRFLTRYPYGPENRARGVSSFNEKQYCWISPVWALAALMGRSVSKTGWPTRLTDRQVAVLEDLALNNTDPAKPIPLETAFSRNRISQLLGAGIIPISCAIGSDSAFIPGENCIGGESIGYQSLMSDVTQFFIWCKDNFPTGLSPSQLEQTLARAIEIFFENRGLGGPESVKVKSDEPGRNDPPDRIPLFIKIYPGRKILPSSKPIELAFYW